MNIAFEPLPDILPAEALTAWHTSCQLSELPDPCCSEPPWVLSYHRAHGNERRVLCMQEHGNMVLFAEQRDKETYLVPLESSWLYDRPLLGSDPLPLFFEALDCIEATFGPANFPVIVLGGMAPHHPFSNELLVNLGHTFAFFLLHESIQCAASLDGGLDTFLANRSANFRQKLKKACGRAQKAGILFERQSPTNHEDAHTCYQRMLAVEQKSWKGQEHNGILHPHTTPFYDLLLTQLAIEGKARVIFAQKDGKDIGFIFGGLSNKIYRGQQFSYAMDCAAYSIGNILQFEQIKWLCDEGCVRYDMGPITGEKMAYKAHWTELRFPLQSWFLRHA